MAPPGRTSDCSSLLIYRPLKDERLSWPSWLTRSRRFHIYNWSLVRCRSSAGQGKFAGQRPTFYHCATPPTDDKIRKEILLRGIIERRTKGKHIMTLHFQHSIHKREEQQKIEKDRELQEEDFIFHNTCTNKYKYKQIEGECHKLAS